MQVQTDHGVFLCPADPAQGAVDHPNTTFEELKAGEIKPTPAAIQLTELVDVIQGGETANAPGVDERYVDWQNSF